jgi:hypothetical protein
MNIYTFENHSKSKQEPWMDQKEMGSDHDRIFKNYREKITARDSDKRPYDCPASGWEIICKTYDPFHDDFKTLHAVACDINEKGMIFFTHQPLEVGDPIFIQVKKSPEEQHNTELHEGLHAQVIGCHKTHDQTHDFGYEVGVEYFS